MSKTRFLLGVFHAGLGLLAAALIPACGGGGSSGGGSGGPGATPSGSLVSSFGAGGIVLSNPSGDDDEALGVHLDGSSMYVVGYDAALGPTQGQWRVEKRALSNGAMVAGFGTGGVRLPNAYAGIPTDIQLGSFLTGSALHLAGTYYPVSIADLWWYSPTFDPTSGGLISNGSNNPTVGDDRPLAVVADASGYFVVGFDSSAGNTGWRIEKRNLATGALIAAFDTDGIVSLNPSAGEDKATAVALDATGLYVAGYYLAGASDWAWRIEKRNLTTGALIAGFGTAGVLTINPSAGDDRLRGMAVDATGLYLIGSDNTPGGGDRQWRIEKRNLTDGSPAVGFGVAGAVTSNASSGIDEPNGLALDTAASAFYIVGVDFAATNRQWRIEKRLTTTGALYPDFGTVGVVQSNPSASNDDHAMGVAVDADAIYVVGFDDANGDEQWRIEKRAK